jgi:uncharacterized protein (TIGR03083 family)
MTELVNQTIAQLRADHDRLAAFVADLTEVQLKTQSGAAEWSVADVLSHLGSGAEIQHHTVSRALGGDDGDAGDAPGNQEIWDRWNALPPLEQAEEFVTSDERLVSLFESLTPEQRSSVRVDLGFLPAPVSLLTPLAMRLNEVTLHGWDARVGIDPAAALSDEAADLVLQHYADAMSFMLGFIGKADVLDQPVRLAVGDRVIAIEDSVGLSAGGGATATYDGPLESVVRLMAGRLSPEHTPEAVEVTGNVTLDDLRRVFPGY